DEAEDDEDDRMLALIAREHARATRVPTRLATELAHLTSLAQGISAEARAAEDMSAFLPTLSEIVTLKQDEAAFLAQGGDAYDALLDDYEPGATADLISRLFAAMRPRLVQLRDDVLGAERQPKRLDGQFLPETQM